MFNDSEAYMNSISNTFITEPEFKCPSCGELLYTDWVDNGFGPYSVQASPYGCKCGWHEQGCKECIKEKCFSWDKCLGRALIKENLPNQQAESNALESASQDKAMDIE